MASRRRADRQARLVRAYCSLIVLAGFGSVMTAQSATSIGSSQASTAQTQTSAQNPVFGSVPETKPTPGVLPITFRDAIERALRHNLAGLLSEYNTIAARGKKWEELSDLLPHVSGDVQEVAQKTSLEALGLRVFPGVSGPLPHTVGPFSYFCLLYTSPSPRD